MKLQNNNTHIANTSKKINIWLEAKYYSGYNICTKPAMTEGEIHTAQTKRKASNIHEKHIYLFPKINSLISHLPATEVRRIVRQNPNLASDFIVIRPTAMTVYTDFGLVVGAPSNLVYTSSGPLILVDTTLFSPPFFLTSAQ